MEPRCVASHWQERYPWGKGSSYGSAGDIPLVVRPSMDLPGAFSIELAGGRTIAPLGPARLGIGTWRLERTSAGDDGWVELVTDDAPSAFLEGLALGMRISLLAGDALATERGGDPVVVVEAD